MKVLITGAGGFIGSHLAEEMLTAGHEVRAFDRAWTNRAWRADDPVEEISGDVTSSEDCRKAAEGCDAVIHLAAVVSDWGDRALFERVNVNGTRTLVTAAREAKVDRFVLMSSVAVHHYGGIVDGTEDLPRDGHINEYALSKIRAEDVLKAESGPMAWTIIRPGVFPFGPRDRTSFLPLADELSRGRGGVIAKGHGLITTAYVKNLVFGMRLALESPAAANETFVIGDDERISWHGLFSALSEELGAPPPRFSLPFSLAYATAWSWESVYRVFGVKKAPLLTRYRVLVAGRDCHFVSDKAKRLLGYQPPVSLKDGIRETVAWYQREKASTKEVS